MDRPAATGRCIRSLRLTPWRSATWRCRGCFSAKTPTTRWLILVPRSPGACEIIDLAEDAQAQLMSEIAVASRALKAVTACDKLNVAAIGNVVPQLHVHVVARRRDDPAWPKPIWGAVAPRTYDRAAMDRLIAGLRHALPLV